MYGIFVIPTGIGCEIGGHAGDANPAVKLIASVTDKLIVNPNAVNASDINEMPDNALYVEGSMIDRFINKEFYLEEVKSNRILVVTNALKNDVINAVNAARSTIGIEADIVVLNTPLVMKAGRLEDGQATGEVKGWKELCNQIGKYHCDAVAITSQIDCDKEAAMEYIENGGVNPWGGVEAKASALISQTLNKPVAHSPIESEWMETWSPPVVDPRLSAEMVSISYLHCVLKGLWRAPRIAGNEVRGNALSMIDFDFMISPMCYGIPHKLCQRRGTPIIFVNENKSIYKEEDISFKIGKDIIVENYLEAVGVIQAMREGVSVKSVRRPLRNVNIHRELGKK